MRYHNRHNNNISPDSTLPITKNFNVEILHFAHAVTAANVNAGGRAIALPVNSCRRAKCYNGS